MRRLRCATEAAAEVPSSFTDAALSIRRTIGASASSDTFTKFLATHARALAMSAGGSSSRRFTLQAQLYRARRTRCLSGIAASDPRGT